MRANTARSARPGKARRAVARRPGTARERQLTLDWLESGIDWSRSPARANRVGLGRTLIEQSLPFQLDAQTRLDIGPDDVRCVVTMAVD